MSSTGSNQRGLAQLIGEDPATLNRFLNADALDRHSRTRPAWLRIADKVELRCLNGKHDIDDDALPPVNSTDSDDEQWYVRHWYRLVAARERYDSIEALLRMGEFCSQALHGPRGYAARMCVNSLLTFSAIIDELDHGAVSNELLRHTLTRVDRLERHAMESMSDEERATLPQRALGYASMGRGFLGLLLEERGIVGHAVQGLINSAAMPHETRFKLWHNTLGFLDLLLAREYPGAGPWSGEAAEIARVDVSDSLYNALRTRELPALKASWRAIVPELLVDACEEEDAR
ncbi:MAG: hypothetical protein AAF682_25645 [Planctomycetota bacterium]